MATRSIGELLFQRCTQCFLLKAVDDFHRQGNRPRSICKPCRVKDVTSWAKANPAKRKDNWQRWRKHNKDRANAQNRDSYRRNPETKRKYVQANRDRIREIHRKSARKHLDTYNAQWHRRRARLLGNGGTHTRADVRSLFEQQNGKCANLACRVTLEKYHIDHIVPIAAGGTNDPDNLQLLCPKCNLKKNHKSPERWALENGLLF